MAAGEFVAVMGPSGCGKSTLLHLAGALESPSAGRVLVDGSDLDALSPVAQAELRRTRLGYVFQRPCLIPALTARENVMLPLRLPVHQADRLGCPLSGARETLTPCRRAGDGRSRPRRRRRSPAMLHDVARPMLHIGCTTAQRLKASTHQVRPPEILRREPSAVGRGITATEPD